MNTNSKKLLQLELALLNKIQNDENITQRSISKELDIALGIANTLVKKFVKKGFLKLKQAPMKRYFYYLTPKGLLEKTKLTKQFVESSLQFYNSSRMEYENLLKKIKTKKVKYLILAGTCELSEIAILAARNISIDVNYVYSKTYNKKKFSGVKVVSKINKKKFNKDNTCFLLTEFSNPTTLYNLLIKDYQIFKPNFLTVD